MSLSNKELNNHLDALIDLAISEDLKYGDVTSQTFIDSNNTSKAVINTRENLILSGTIIAQKVFKKIDPTLDIKIKQIDGASLKKNSSIMEISGNSISILSSERIVLNFLQHLSGIATITSKYVSVIKKIKNNKAKIYDTRKTLPGYRSLEKQAIVHGGGFNHRHSLFDMAMIKDNHLLSLTSTKINKKNQPNEKFDPFNYKELEETLNKKLESLINKNIDSIIEVDNLKQLEFFLKINNLKIILLDNMTNNELKEAVKMRDYLFSTSNEKRTKILLEASGGITLDTVSNVAKTGVDRISIGSITHSARAVDIGMDFL